MHHNEGGSGDEFDNKISITDGIDTVAAECREIEQFSSGITVDGKRSSGKCTATQWRDVGPLQTTGQPLPVTFEHLIIGHEVMRKKHWLGVLQMGESSHDYP